MDLFFILIIFVLFFFVSSQRGIRRDLSKGVGRPLGPPESFAALSSAFLSMSVMQFFLVGSLLATKSLVVWNEETLVAACVTLFVVLSAPLAYEKVEQILEDLEGEVRSQKRDLLGARTRLLDSYRSYLSSIVETSSQKELVFSLLKRRTAMSLVHRSAQPTQKCFPRGRTVFPAFGA